MNWQILVFDHQHLCFMYVDKTNHYLLKCLLKSNTNFMGSKTLQLLESIQHSKTVSHKKLT